MRTYVHAHMCKHTCMQVVTEARRGLELEIIGHCEGRERILRSKL